MPKKKSLAIEEALSASTAPQGWKQQFSDNSQSLPASNANTAKSQEKPERLKRKTYLMTDALIQRAEAQAELYHVGVNEMVRYCLDFALSLMESGKHTPEVQEVTIKKTSLNV